MGRDGGDCVDLDRWARDRRRGRASACGKLSGHSAQVRHSCAAAQRCALRIQLCHRRRGPRSGGVARAPAIAGRDRDVVSGGSAARLAGGHRVGPAPHRRGRLHARAGHPGHCAGACAHPTLSAIFRRASGGGDERALPSPGDAAGGLPGGRTALGGSIGRRHPRRFARHQRRCGSRCSARPRARPTGHCGSAAGRYAPTEHDGGLAPPGYGGRVRRPRGRGAMSETSWAALQALLVDHYAELKRRLASRLGSTDLAVETLQETWLRLERPGNPGVLERPDAYLFRMALNIAADRRDSDRRRLTLSEIEMLRRRDDDELDPERIAASRSEMAVVVRALHELSPRCRAILIAARLDGLPHELIAARHGISTRMVAREVKRALDHCGERLGRISRQGFGSPPPDRSIE